MNTNSKWIILSTLSVGVLGGLYMLFNKKQTVPLNVSRNQIVLFLKDLKAQSLSQYRLNAQVVKKIIAETGGQQQKDGKSVGEYIRDEVQSVFDQKKNMLFIKHDLNESDLASSLEDHFKNDKEINLLVEEIFGGFENSLKGIEPNIQVRPEVLEILTKEKAMMLVKKIMLQSSKCFLQVITELQSKGETDISLKNPKLIRKMGQLDMRAKKRVLFEEEGLNLEPDSPTEALGKVTEKYKDEDSDFNLELKDIDRKYTYVMERLGTEIKTEEQIDSLLS